MFFKFTTAGESHGKALIAIIEGLPAGMPVDIDAINHELWRRQQGYGRGGRMKIEKDEVEILSGVRHGKTLGSPIALMIENKDFIHWREVMSADRQNHQREGVGSSESTDADAAVSEPQHATKNTREVKRPRPGHADLSGGQKFGARDLRNILERASARETAARVAAGALAKQLIAQFGVEVRSHVIQLGGIPEQPLSKTWDEICLIADDSPLRCTNEPSQSAMMAAIDRAKENGDTLGGIYEVVAKGVPVGLGSHTSWNEKLDGRIAQAFMSIHATKAVEIGTGVANAALPGSQVHDEIYWSEPPADTDGGDKGFVRRTNRAGGLEGGITNGEELRIRGYMKPISTLRKPLHSVDIDTKKEDLAAFERSDITAVPAAGVIGEAMLAIVLANSMREKFGGDSIEEMKRNFDSYSDSLRNY
ncbi:MAG: chorismate synthase [Pyrinomonadaceae bacterium]